MLVEKRYPLRKEVLMQMLKLKLESEEDSTMALELNQFTRRILKMVEKPVLNNKGRVTGQKEIRPVWNNALRVNHQNKFTHPHPKRNFIPTAVATKSGQVPVNAAKQSSPRVVASISTTRPVNTAAPKPKVNDELPMTYSYFKVHSPVRRAFNQKSTAKTNNFNEKVNTARVNNVTIARPKAVVSAAVGNGENAIKSSACWIWIPIGNVIDNTSKDCGSYKLKRFDYVDLHGRLNSATIDESNLWHRRLGHINFKTMNKLVRGNLVRGLPLKLFENDHTCVACQKGKQHKASCIENQINHKVKIIRCDNGTEFKNNDMNQFCGMKGIKREFSVARTPQQNRVNRILVTKPHNETPYELLHGTLPSISFMRPFGCLVTIINTLDPLGKFDEKSDEGFFVRYSINSKAFRVFNTRTRKVERTLHITFLKTKPNWNQTNRIAGIKDNVDVVPTQQYILLPLLYDSPQSSKDAVASDAGKKITEEPANKGQRNGQEKEEGASNKEDSTVSPSVSAAGQSFTNADDPPISSNSLRSEDDLKHVGETTMNFIPILNNQNPKTSKNQIIGDINSATQTRRMTEISKEHAMVS
ncbi:ribonuclease H-like domain-containing protein [Tanacetum coccineum]|uniref:Ribonuclease H-like domain-containing protein n=1 Tax=Tanacetum coccineum TaxID=301880 RepID=A0ABQ5EL13_9ASTR